MQSQDQLSKDQLKALRNDLFHFKQSALYAHFKSHFATILEVTVDQILDVELKGPETLYSREAWIGEARAARLQVTWFDDLESEILKQIEQED